MKGILGEKRPVALAIAALMTIPASGAKVILEATGDPFQDSGRLQDAMTFHTPGDTLHLKGHFRLGHMIWTHGFDGVIKGDGKEETIIEASGFPGDPPQYIGPVIMLFEQVPGTSVTIKDLTFFYPGGVIDAMGNPLTIDAMVNPYWGHDASFTLKNVRMATPDPMVVHGLLSWHSYEVEPGNYVPGEGSTTATECEFFGMQWGVAGGGSDGGDFTVTGSHFVGNRQGVSLNNSMNCRMNIKDNLLDNTIGGIRLFNVNGDINVKNNTVYNRALPAVNLIDSIGVQVKDNYCEGFAPGRPDRSVIRLVNSTECLVANNTVVNTIGSNGIIMEQELSWNNTYIGNTFINTQVNIAAFQIAGDGATILNNNFLDSGIPGGEGPGLYQCIHMMPMASHVYVGQSISLLPWGNQNPDDQIIDYGTDNVIVTYP